MQVHVFDLQQCQCSFMLAVHLLPLPTSCLQNQLRQSSAVVSPLLCAMTACQEINFVPLCPCLTRNSQGWSPRGICLGSRWPRGSFLTGSASPLPHRVLPWSCLGLDLTALASALLHSICFGLGSVWYVIDHKARTRNYYMCIVHDIKTTQTTSISFCLASASSSLPLPLPRQNCLQPTPD